jgi:transcriptional regulator GlxA family with amidase domain
MLRRVVIVAYDRCQALDVVGPLEVFAGASEAQARRGALAPGYAPLVVGVSPTVRAQSGLEIATQATLAGVGTASAPSIDTLIVAGGRGARAAARDSSFVHLVGRTAKRSRRVASVCTGAFVLAAAGLLERRRATTHWAYCDSLAQMHPGVRVEKDPIYVRDGKVWTSAGVSAGIDLALAMVEEDLGRELAMLIARWLVVFVRRAGGQSQFSTQLQAQAAERVPIRELQTLILEHPEAALDVPALAKHAAMSVRHFGRVFRAEVGLSPAAYVERVRVETARRLLETSVRSVDDVAAASGFGTPESLRRAFARRVGLSPREYRARFGARSRGAES